MRIFTAVLLAGTLLATPALVQPVEPGQEGALATFVKPEAGARACFERVYDSAHLARHPAQTVEAMTFRIAYFMHEPDDVYPQGQRNYYFDMTVKRRDEVRTLHTGGECTAIAGSAAISCNVECDGGGVEVTRSKTGGILVDLTATWGIRLAQCDGGEEDTVALEAGADDKVFLLAPASSCPAYEDW